MLIPRYTMYTWCTRRADVEVGPKRARLPSVVMRLVGPARNRLTAIQIYMILLCVL